MPDFLWQLLNGALLLTYLLSALVAFGALLGLLGGLVAQPPIPLLLAVCSSTALMAVRHDKFNPDTLRWRALGGVALYAAATLGYTLYTGYLQHLQARDWSLFPQGSDHLALLAQG